MYSYGRSSLDKIHTLHPKLQLIMNHLIEIMDVKVIWGYRGEIDQNLAFESGNSKKRFPESKHNRQPSLAVDVVPYPEDWNNVNRFYYMDGVVKGIAHSHGIKIRGGWDWDSDGDITDQNFNDLAHFELVEE